MSETDLHPEALFDRLAAGTLSDSERETLQEHCKDCSICALEWRLREAAAVADNTIDRATIAAVAHKHLATKRSKKLTRLPFRRALLVAATFAMLSATAMAAVWIQRVVTQHSDDSTRELPKQKGPKTPPPQPPPPTEPEAEPETAPSEAEPTGTDAADPPPAGRKRSARKPPTPVPSAGELFEQGRARRTARSYAEARDAFEELVRRYPTSAEAQVARISLGNLYLTQFRDPKRAERTFASYLRHESHTSLAAEARVGLAESFRLRGDRQGEVAAWKEVLSHHPGSIHARKAVVRLRELD
ncbi:MAG: tetratricopeptide repeat protein [Myxococcales bacterium]|nr:tetratricopeptide repeat protein [Myxococcales bacterium]